MRSRGGEWGRLFVYVWMRGPSDSAHAWKCVCVCVVAHIDYFADVCAG